MKVKTNWLDHQNFGDKENGIFEKKGSDERNKAKYPEFYIIKKEKKASENFSMLLLSEFNGSRVYQGRNKSDQSRLPNYGKLDLNQRKNPSGEKELLAVNFLNEYWA